MQMAFDIKGLLCVKALFIEYLLKGRDSKNTLLTYEKFRKSHSFTGLGQIDYNIQITEAMDKSVGWSWEKGEHNSSGNNNVRLPAIK